MKTIYLDFETYFADDYTLSKMTPVQYILDPRYETNGLAVIEPGVPPYWVDGPDVPAFFAKLDPKDTNLVTHNALFDMCIVAWRYGFVPRLMGCTASIARASLGHVLRRVSLASVSDHLGLGEKGKTLLKVKGMNLPMIKAAGLYGEYVEYGIDDALKCKGIYEKLVIEDRFPTQELLVMDSVLRCAIEPRFWLDMNKLAEHLNIVQQEKAHLLAQSRLIGVNGKSDLMSNEKFAELLLQHGVSPPRKMSLVTGRETYAFAKTDEEFRELLEHENPAVQILVNARLGHKSTLEESRCERLISIGNLQWPVTYQGNVPVPLRYSGAHTHRLSGDWSLNMQNLPRGGNLRRALLAPPGHKVIKIDSSQIEARGVAVLCGQDDLTGAFARGEDVYSNFAAEIFQKPVNKRDNPNERFVGKEGILSLGYGAGAPKFQERVKYSSKIQTGTAIELSDDEAKRIVNTYRNLYHMVPNGWQRLNVEGIPALQRGSPYEFGPCKFEKEAILLPNGLRLFYHQLKQSGGEWWFTYGGIPKKLYGGKLLENITQALARVVVMEAANRIRKRLDRFVLQAHDELVFIVPDERVEEAKSVLMEEMCRRPIWAPSWPLAAEIGVGDNYGDAR